ITHRILESECPFLGEHDAGRDPNCRRDFTMSSEVLTAQTIVACLTPAGSGAIATLALWGPRAWDVVRELFRTHAVSQPHLPADAEVGPVWLGRLGEATSDEVVLTVKGARPVPWI